MDGLIELIFNGVPDGAVDSLVYTVLQRADICEVSHSERGRLDLPPVGQDLMLLLKKEVEPASIFVKALYSTVGGVLIRQPLVRILRFEGLNEVAIVFGSADIEATDRQDVVRRLAAGAGELNRDACAGGTVPPDRHSGAALDQPGENLAEVLGSQAWNGPGHREGATRLKPAMPIFRTCESIWSGRALTPVAASHPA